MSKLDGKTALVTGAARGIGAAIAKLFVNEGANVVLTDILEAEGQALADELGSKAHFMAHDVSDEGTWEHVLNETVATFGKLDILVNNAGLLMFKAIEDLSVNDMRKQINVNLIGTMIGTQLAGKIMTNQGHGGSIVNMSSADGLSAANGLSAYVASKWGIRGFTKAAALELGLHNIRVNSIHPGGVDTPMANPMNYERDKFDMGFKVYAAQRGCAPEEIAHAALYFASDDSRYCMGSELAVDGGLTAGHYYFGFPGAPK